MKHEPGMVSWVKSMAQMRARAGTIAQQCNIPIGVARRLYKEAVGQSSPSGQNPASLDWYLKTPLRRYQSATLLQMYGVTRAKMDPRFAYPSAFYHFSRLMGSEVKGRSSDPAIRDDDDDYSFPYQRGQFLVSIYCDNKDSLGRYICDVGLKRCNACMTVFLGLRADVEPNCPLCSGD